MRLGTKKQPALDTAPILERLHSAKTLIGNARQNADGLERDSVAALEKLMSLAIEGVETHDRFWSK